MIKSSKKFKVFLGTLFLAVLALFTVAYAADDDGKITLAKTAKRYDDYGRKSRVALNVSANSYTKSLKLDVVLVLDGSGSMAYGPNGEKDKVNVNNPSRLTSAKKAAKTFISTLITDDDNVKIGLVEYGKSIKNTQALTENEKILNNFIDNKYSASGGTNLQAGIEKAHKLLDNGSREDSKKLVVILTDGIPTLFNYEGKVYGYGSTDDSVCLKGSLFGCDLQKKPSEAAKEELDSLKNNYKKSDVYTITLGNEKEAANILSKVNPEQENPLYKNYKALTGDELQERFNEILNNEIKTIGSSSVVTDTIPAKFKLTKESESNLAKKGVEIVENEDGTTTLKWNIGTIETGKNYSLSYDVEALDDYHGSMYTNTSAILKTTVKEDNPYYAGKTNQELEFNKPTTQVPIITHDDNYSGYEDEVVKGSIFDNDLNKIKELDKEKQTDKLEVRDTLIVKEDANTVKNNDGTYTLYKDGVAQGTLTIDEDGKFTFTPNEGIVGDVSFKYSITTDVITNGKKDSVYSNESTVVINIKPIERVEVEGSKIWVDNNNQDGIRPDKITVKLLANGNLVDSKTVNSKDNWTYKFTNLPKYTKYHENEEQYLIKYTIDEIEVAGYTSKVEGYNIVNTHEVDKTKVSGNKTWVDNNNQDGIRPDKIRVNLLKNNKVIDTKEVTANDNWSYEFSNLDKNENGSEIKYSVVEDTITGYKTKIEGYNITNTHTPELYGNDGKYTVTKIWNDNNNQDGIRDSYEVTLTGVIEDQDEQVYEKTVTLTKDKTSYTWTNLAKYNNGKEIKYTVDETKVPTGYTKLVDGTKITNTHTLELINNNTGELKVTKIWNDNNNQDGIRPDKIKVSLYIDGKKSDKSLILSLDNNWTGKFTNLPKYKSEGKEVKYTVKEESIKNYTSNNTGSVENGYVITNTHTPELYGSDGKYTVTKIWNDNNNQDGIRDSYEVTLTGVIENQDEPVYENTVTLTKDKTSYTWTNLAKYNNGKEIKYTVDETKVPTGYTKLVDGTKITNTHETLKTEVVGTKTWLDNNNQDGVRPKEIIVKLLANGVDTGKTVKVTADSNWQYSFTNLDTNSDGKEIKYTVEEQKVPNYTTKVDGYNIINTHEVEKTEVAGTKTWLDNDNQDGKRPDKITIRLLANNVDTGLKATASADTDWKYSFTNLDKKANGKDIVYTVTEDEVESYQGVIDGYNITNTHTPETITFSFEKIWVDANNQDGIRPDKIKVNLLADGKVVDTKEIIGETKQNWQSNFTDLPKYNNGREIEYSVKEEAVPSGYEVSYKDNNTIINTHSPSKRMIEGTKTWNDNDNNDGIRPDKITVKLFADNIDTGKTFEVSSKTNWQYKFEDLPEYRDGNKIIYTVNEEDVLGYSSEIKGFDIVNTHEVEKISINGTKIWDDHNNNDGIRPDEITVKLLANGIDTGKTAIASVDTNWQYSFPDLNKYKNGEEITYSLEEVSIDGYISEVNQEDYNITNTHSPETITYTVNKKWVDANNNDGIRPESINVSILANGVVIDKTSLSKENNWTYTFGPYNKYENGNLIQYTIVEDAVECYVQTIEEGVIDNNNNITSVITNTHEVEKETITINKIWNDNNNEQQTRPEFINVKLLANGEVIREFTITKDMNWSYILDNLNKYYNGKLINYSILEDKVDNYQTSYNGFDIINTLTKKYEKAEIIPPQTGDNSSDSESILFMILGLLSLTLALKRVN